MRWIVKYYSLLFCRFLLKFFFSFYPVKKNLVVFICFDGEKVTCNPWYIYKYIMICSSNYECRWILRDGKKAPNIPPNQIVKNGGYSYYKYMLTAGFIITNDRLPSYLSFRRSQFVINTWHGGGAFKRTFGYPHGIKKWYINKTTNQDSYRTNLFLSSSKMWSEVIARKSFHYKGEILETGFPRNDIFFSQQISLASQIRRALGVEDNIDIILYAPTHRGSNELAAKIIQRNPLDFEVVCEIWKKKFCKECVVLYRGHHSMKNGLSLNNAIDVSNYPDMQELLLVSTALISDYSSCLWDYALTDKPCFIYAPDFEEYLKEPGFESDFNGWPFIICKSNNELNKSILSFKQDFYTKAVKKYLESYGSFEKGTASQQLLARMDKHLLSH